MDYHAAAAAPAPVPFPASAPVKDEGVEDFEITDVYLIYNDGRLISHASVEEEEGVDKQLMSSMLVAIQGFTRESFQAETGLDGFEFGGRKVVLCGGNYVILAAVVEGTEPAVLREEMSSVVSKIEGMYAGVVEAWTGVTNQFKDVNRYMLPLFKLRSKMKIKKKKKIVKVKSGIEFYSGYVRLKVGVTNELGSPIKDINLTFDYDHSTLRLSHIEPDYPMSESTIFLPEIHATEKRTVAVYFDPIICQESHIDGWATYIDGDGNPGEAEMKRRPVDIVCPIFYTKETLNVAMLKRLVGELKYKDSKIYNIESKPTLKAAYMLAVEAVRGHDVKLIREFKEPDPYEAETWFYGEVRETDEKLVIRVAARETEEYLEIHVASSNLASMTGLLAELGSEFAKKVDERAIVKEVLQPSTDRDIKKEIEKIRLLLDKFAESEIETGETEPDM
jgi:hypothetical protein